MNTTYVERNNSSDEVCRRANELIQHETHDGKTLMQVESFVTCYKNSRMERLSRIYQMSSNHPVRHITFAPPPREHKNLLLLWNTPNRRVGIPRFEYQVRLCMPCFPKRGDGNYRLLERGSAGIRGLLVCHIQLNSKCRGLC